MHPTLLVHTDEAPETRALILDTAARLLCEAGLAGTTMRLIADACGIKAGSLYHHFQSKDEIVLEVLNDGIRIVDASVRTILARTGPDANFHQLFRAAVRAHLQSFLGRANYTAANLRIFKQVSPEIRNQNLVFRRRYEGIWSDLLAKGVEDGAIRPELDLSVLKLFILSALNSAVEWYRPGGLSIDALADSYVELLLRGASTLLLSAAAPPQPIKRKPAARARCRASS